MGLVRFNSSFLKKMERALSMSVSLSNPLSLANCASLTESKATFVEKDIAKCSLLPLNSSGVGGCEVFYLRLERRYAREAYLPYARATTAEIQGATFWQSMYFHTISSLTRGSDIAVPNPSRASLKPGAAV